MIEAGNEVEVVRGSWWSSKHGNFNLLGKKGIVVNPKSGPDERFVVVQFEEHGEVALFLNEVKVIE